MKTLRIFLSLILSAAAFIVPVFGNITLTPQFSDSRFPPVDKLHAGCLNTSDVAWEGEFKDTKTIHLVMKYLPNELEILRVSPTIKNGSYAMSYDTITFDQSDFSSFQGTKNNLFQIFFKNKEAITGANLLIDTGSFLVTKAGQHVDLKGKFSLTFEAVAECEPDIIPPSVDLVSPKNINEKLPLDAYFIFALKDIGKGIDKNSVYIKLDNESYFGDSANLKWNGDYLTFYPENWLPVNQKITLTLKVGDKQKYGAANMVEQSFTFETATGMLLQDFIKPNIFRRIVKKSEAILGTSAECMIMQRAYDKSAVDVKIQSQIKSILNKIGCDVPNGTMLIDPDQGDEHGAADTDVENSQMKYISVFAAIGWILFFLAFGLKLHYLVAYKRHKRINKFFDKDAQLDR